MSKKIEPTDAMVDEVANALALEVTGTALHLQTDLAKQTCRLRARVALRVALNHPGVRGLFADEDDRPWEPLNGPARAGDEVRQDRHGLTITGVVGRVDGSGDPWTAEGAFIGLLDIGTWWVRHAVQDLPTEPGAVIVPADGREYIRATANGSFRRASEAVLGPDGRWHGVWRKASGRVPDTSISPSDITPGTWKVDDQ